MNAAGPVPPAANPQRVAVAVSGGRDSTALWHATASAACGTGLEVVALHVHHGLVAGADAWVRHLQRQARRWASRGLPVRLTWCQLQGSPGRGDSTEAWARRARYAALADMARAEGIDIVLLAHHRRDQAETFLLQALRGAGPAGLASMPREAQREGIVWARPWLDHPRSSIEAYVRRHRLGFVDDPSNADLRLDRNRLRHRVWPVLAEAFEQAEASLAASARRDHEAAACLRELAQIDALQACTEHGALDVAAWHRLSAARRANLLRAWLGGIGQAGVPETLVQRLLDELPQARAGASWPWPDGVLRLHGGQLGAYPLDDGAGGPGPDPSRERKRKRAPDLLPIIDLSREGRVCVPEWHGSFEVCAVPAGGVDPGQLGHCEVRARGGGERFQRAAGTPPRSLKKQFQALGVPAWQRDGPLLYCAGRLLFVPGLGIDARWQAPEGARSFGLRWLPDQSEEAPGGGRAGARR